MLALGNWRGFCFLTSLSLKRVHWHLGPASAEPRVCRGTWVSCVFAPSPQLFHLSSVAYFHHAFDPLVFSDVSRNVSKETRIEMPYRLF